MLGGQIARGDAIRRDHQVYDQARGAVETRGETIVGELRAIADACLINVRTGKRTVCREYHLDDDGKAIGFEVERSEVGREFFRQHRKDLGGGVDGGRVLSRGRVDCRPQRDDGGDICNGDENLGRATGLSFRDGELIEVTRIVVVDRAP
jgi:hypothetical protein